MIDIANIRICLCSSKSILPTGEFVLLSKWECQFICELQLCDLTTKIKTLNSYYKNKIKIKKTTKEPILSLNICNLFQIWCSSTQVETRTDTTEYTHNTQKCMRNLQPHRNFIRLSHYLLRRKTLLPSSAPQPFIAICRVSHVVRCQKSRITCSLKSIKKLQLFSQVTI